MNERLLPLGLMLLPMLAWGAVEHAPDGHAAHPGVQEAATRTIEVSMDDRMRFLPAKIEVAAGETVRFIVRNQGSLAHEMVLGTLAELQAHAAHMRAHPEMRHVEENAVSLAPQQQGELLWTFSEPGVVDFACLLPGHFEAGMAGRVEVL